jgi:hypothetical protein
VCVYTFFLKHNNNNKNRYKTLCSSIDVAITQGDDVSPSAVQCLRRLHDRVSRQGEPKGLTDSMTHLLSQTATHKIVNNRKKKEPRSNAQTRRQSKTVPLLVYQIEQLEYSYLRLQKSSNKTIDFSDFMRRSQCRDFRIQNAALVNEEEEEEEEEEEDDDDDDDDDEEEEEEEDDEEEDSQETEASIDDRKRARSALGDRSNSGDIAATQQRNVKRRRKVVDDDGASSQM